MEIDGVATEPVFVEFVNSEWYDGRGNVEERLLDARWRSAFLSRWRLGKVEGASTHALRSLTELRAALRAVVEEMHEGRSPSTARLQSLASGLPPVSMRLRIVGGARTASWTAIHPSWASVEAEIIRSCFEFLASPGRERLGRCENDGCRWAFVDASRNRSRRWCDPAICGNVAKVRAYRERHRSS